MTPKEVIDLFVGCCPHIKQVSGEEASLYNALFVYLDVDNESLENLIEELIDKLIESGEAFKNIGAFKDIGTYRTNSSDLEFFSNYLKAKADLSEFLLKNNYMEEDSIPLLLDALYRNDRDIDYLLFLK